jgi:hypothetical protein
MSKRANFVRGLGLAVSAGGPMFAAIGLLQPAGGSVGDRAVERSVGLLFGSPALALDGMVGSVFQLLPLGSRAFRSGLAGAAILGVVAACVYLLVQQMLARVTPRRAGLPWLMQSTLALWVALTTALHPSVLEVASRPGGSLLGAALVLLPLLLAKGDPKARKQRWFLLGLSLAYDLRAGLFASLALWAASLVDAQKRPAFASPKDASREAPKDESVMLMACLPLLLLVAGLLVPNAEHERWGLHRVWTQVQTLIPRPAAFASTSFLKSVPLPILGLAGFGLLVPAWFGAPFGAELKPQRAKLLLTPAAAALVIVSCASMLLPRYLPPFTFVLGRSLVLLFSAQGIAGVWAMTHAKPFEVLRIPRAVLRAGFVAIGLLLVTLPLHQLEAARYAKGPAALLPAAAEWQARTFSDLPPRATLLLQDASMIERCRAMQSLGELRTDLDVVSLPQLTSAHAARTTVRRHPKLAALLRDMILTQEPTELSLSELAADGPLLLDYSPEWPRPLSRHLVPAGMFTAFESEPRGLSERRVALLAGADFARRVGSRRAMVGEGHEALRSMTRERLRRLAFAMSSTGEKESAALAMENLRLFDPNDETAAELAKRIVLAKGGIIDISGMTDALKTNPTATLHKP